MDLTPEQVDELTERGYLRLVEETDTEVQYELTDAGAAYAVNQGYLSAADLVAPEEGGDGLGGTRFVRVDPDGTIALVLCDDILDNAALSSVVQGPACVANLRGNDAVVAWSPAAKEDNVIATFVAARHVLHPLSGFLRGIVVFAGETYGALGYTTTPARIVAEFERDDLPNPTEIR